MSKKFEVTVASENKETLEQFVEDLENIYAHMVKSKILPNRRQKGFHIFLHFNLSFKKANRTLTKTSWSVQMSE